MTTKLLTIPCLPYPPECEPRYQTHGAAAVDLHSTEDSTVIDPGSWKVFKTGLAIAIPQGFFGLMSSRSGNAAKRGLFVLNSAGIIDADYRGEIGVILANFGNQRVRIDTYERIAQLALIPVLQAEFIVMPHLPQTKRGTAGFGSTGV